MWLVLRVNEMRDKFRQQNLQVNLLRNNFFILGVITGAVLTQKFTNTDLLVVVQLE